MKSIQITEILEEDLPDLDPSITGTAVAKYSVISESIRSSVLETGMCAMFCGGKNCKYESVDRWKEELQAIKGLYSSWITPNILAMARPNTEMIDKCKIIEQFKEYKIKSIINLQIPGEHRSCGPPLGIAGFTYEPEQFMEAGISFYNYGWKDYGVGSMTNIADMVRVMQFAISEGKVAIHCHAGLGRTGVLIVCYLIYANRVDPDVAIHYIRSKRPGTVQSNSQIRCIRDFSRYLMPLRVVFSSISNDVSHFTLSQYLSRQRYTIHGAESRRLKFLPKIIYVCCHRILDLARIHCFVEEHLDKLIINKPKLKSKSDQSDDDRSCDDQDEFFRRLPKEQPVVESISLPTSIRHSVSLESFCPINLSKLNMSGRTSPTFRGKEKFEVKQNATSSVSRKGKERPQTAMRGISGRKGKDEKVSLHQRMSLAIAMTEYDDETVDRVNTYKQQLNSTGLTWSELTKEENPVVLACLMLSWLDELKEPILTPQELPAMLQHQTDPSRGIAELDKGAQQTIFYLFYVASCLFPLPDSLQNDLLQRILSTLTHQNMVLELDDLTSNHSQSIFSRTSNDSGLMRGTVASRLMHFFMAYIMHIKEKIQPQVINVLLGGDFGKSLIELQE